ncbi:DUF7662 domain-containing protein [Phenylobacterium sp.]|uniref:DUF7662 domain-containing protein n=1 Tax=Phenylobacterium sp. TaxID=1871053 RepID=UPI002D09B53A|nr:hypothetical protein [Phenylobacterium sp.]HLZ74233.1 hypothetical protein [Phenylobacterium sp.]
MGKYDPLKTFLLAQAGDAVPMTFVEIERVLGTTLPRSKRYPAWWSNNPSNNMMTDVWLDAGFMTEQVDIAGERLVFRRKPSDLAASGVAEAAPAFLGGRAGWLGRLRAQMRGTVQVAPGWDLTQPTGEVWDAERE